jgi:hypothetical protein
MEEGQKGGIFSGRGRGGKWDRISSAGVQHCHCPRLAVCRKHPDGVDHPQLGAEKTEGGYVFTAQQTVVFGLRTCWLMGEELRDRFPSFDAKEKKSCCGGGGGEFFFFFLHGWQTPRRCSVPTW